jgi:uncharacterized SAM-binding protein YcdF (DUF218 family)
LATLALFGVAFGIAYYNSNALLTIDSGPVKADAIVVLGGGWNERSQRAAELFKDGAAPKIIVTGKGDCAINLALLERAGVPGEAIQTECDARSTRENALLTLPLLRKAGAHRVILVTTWYHSRRALACFKHYAPDVQFYSEPSLYAADERRDWRRKGVASYICKELLKIPGYWVCYGVKPW